jgi:acetyl-CoA acetyltransferase family protein
MDVHIVEAARSPISNQGGVFDSVHAVPMAAHSVEAVVRRAGIDPQLVDHVSVGSVYAQHVDKPHQSFSREVTEEAGLPRTTTAADVSVVCGSSQYATGSLASMIESGIFDFGVAAGVEVVGVASHRDIFDIGLTCDRTGRRMIELVNELCAVRDAEAFGDLALTKERIDRFAAESYARVLDAVEANRWGEIEPFTVGPKSDPITLDEEPLRFKGKTRDQIYDAIAVQSGKGGPCTVLNSSKISAGSAAVLMASGAMLKKHGLKSRARIVGWTLVGGENAHFMLQPVKAVRKVLAKYGLTLDDIDLFEFNEAFGAQSVSNLDDLQIDLSKVNVNGGAVALGHPLGASGVRVIVTLINAMEQRGAKRGLAVLCIGSGESIAIIVERA